MEPVIFAGIIGAVATIISALLPRFIKSQQADSATTRIRGRTSQTGDYNVGSGSTVQGSYNVVHGRPMERDFSFSPEAYKELQQRDQRIRALEGEAAEARSLIAELDARIRGAGWLDILRGAIPALAVGVAIGMAIQFAATPKGPAVTSGSAPTAIGVAPSSDAAASVVQAYFNFARQGDLDGQRTLVTADYLRNAGGKQSFDKYWSSALAVDWAISPGREPVIDSSDPTAVWVQAAWRISTKQEISVATVDWHVAWLKVISEGSSYRIDERRSSNVASCPSGELYTCAPQDPFNA